VPDVEEAVGRRSPLLPQEVQAPHGAVAVELVAVHLELRGDSVALQILRAREVATKVEVDVLRPRENGTPDLLLVDEGVALVLEQVEQVLQALFLSDRSNIIKV